MRKLLLAGWFICSACIMEAQQKPIVSLDKFGDAISHWNDSHKKDGIGHYLPEQYREIADNFVAYQNEDGGWPKNIDWTAIADADSVKGALDARHRLSTLDNSNVYPQVEYLSQVFNLTLDSTYLHSARRGMEYMLATQYPNGGWRGWDADAITFNDGIMVGVLSTWNEVLKGKAPYEWVAGELKQRIAASWNKGLELVLKTQYVQNGVKTAWAQQYDHTTLMPIKARAYELPGLSASESAEVAMLLMRIKNPSPEVIEAVKAAAAWFDKTKIVGKRVETIAMPEGNPDDPKVKKDRRLVDDPDAKKPLWSRYYELEDNRTFFCNRDGGKVYTLAEVAPERRVGYTWYGSWGDKVLKRYKKWLKALEEKE